jgi:hypothetical protein
LSSLTLESESKAYFNFINSIKSDVTKEVYRNALKRFLQHCKLDIETLAKTDVKDIETLLIDYIVKLKKDKKSFSSMNVVTSALTHYCVMNDKFLMVKKVNKLKVEI